MGDGVLSVDGKEWKPEAPGLSALTPLYEAAEVSKSECQSCKCLRMTSAHWQSSAPRKEEHTFAGGVSAREVGRVSMILGRVQDTS